MIRTYFSAATRGLFSARSRTLLALLGIMMGIFLIITLLGIGVGVEKHITDRLTDLGPEVLAVTSSNNKEAGGDSIFSTVDTLSSRSFGLDDIDAIRKVENVTAVAPVQYIPGRAQYQSKKASLDSIIASTNINYNKVRHLNLQSGHFFTADNQKDKNIQAVIGSDIKNELFGQAEAVGKLIQVDGHELEVVGVLADSQTSDAGTGSASTRNMIYTSSSLEESPKLASTYTMILVKVNGIKNTTEVKKSINNALSSYHSDSNFRVVASDDLIKQSINMLDVLSALIAILAVISLFMSGIGIMSMMVVSVTDRTKEIGVRKTVGATSANIFWQFLIEAVLLTLAGGLLGIALSFLVAFVVGRVLPFQPVMSPELVLIGVTLSVTVGVLFGVGPAINAARKEPIEALHTDHT